MPHNAPIHVWLLFPADRDVAPTRYTNKRFLEVAEAEQCRIEIIDPRAIPDNVLWPEDDSLSALRSMFDLPQIVLARSGARMGKKGRQLMRLLERDGSVTVLPTASALWRAGDKIRTADRLTEHNLATPLTFALEGLDLAHLPLDFPMVLKRARGSKGVQVALCQDLETLKQAAEALPGKSPLLIQQFIKASFGRDIRVFISGGQALAAIERRGAEGEFRSNIAMGGNAIEVPMDAELESLAVKAAKALELDFAGVDILCGQDGYLVCEVNAAPGFEAVEEVTGLDVASRMLQDAKAIDAARR
ncbi:RimK family alpha-L-glutamate ligase [Thalassococcus sp. S3]|uniref:ATP-grasp domain-containing protein n=1 Tax=Thalassococcus sp. S3 TaxID=2017482 RepID=UPI00102459AF|nr:RimK family alpha-L-glutamate ligase [Thalassococcus sp. S3]QBF32756.1 hypothetical protein CFI11_16260 [Thalassococcus sp. S3]